MSEMDTGFQQLFYTDSNHNFPLVKTPNQSGHPAEHGIGFDVVMARSPPHGGEFKGRFPASSMNPHRKKDCQDSKGQRRDNLYFLCIYGRVHLNTVLDLDG
jgi:hypothetical protein